MSSEYDNKTFGFSTAQLPLHGDILNRRALLNHSQIILPDQGIESLIEGSNLEPRSKEESFVQILGRSRTNSHYKCPECNHVFTGGNQKIRVHVTGNREGGTAVRQCTNPTIEAFQFCMSEQERKQKFRDEKKDANKPKSLGSELMDDSHLRKRKAEEVTRTPASPDKYLEAWELLNTASKQRETGTDTNILGVAKILDDLGVEKASDLALLDDKYIQQLSNQLKVVPAKIFLELLAGGAN